MLSRKDLNSADFQTVKVSESPETVVAANGEEQTKEDATVYVKEMKFVRDSNGRSLKRKTLRGSRIFQRVDQWSETTTHQRWQTNNMQHGELRTDRYPLLIDKLLKLSCTYISDINTAGSSCSFIASRINKKWEYEWHRTGKPSRGPEKTTNKKNNNERLRRDPLRDWPEWLHEFDGESCGRKSSSIQGRTPWVLLANQFQSREWK